MHPDEWNGLRIAPNSALVCGDVMLDRYLCGGVARISPEAPVPIVKMEREYARAGGAGNVAISMAALGCRVTIASAVGTDSDAVELEEILEGTGRVNCIFARSRSTRTICKTRITTESHQQLLRFDQDGCRETFEAGARGMLDEILGAIPNHEVVVLADYDKGFITPELARAVISECKRYKLPCIVDPKKADFSTYRGATVLTPNIKEAERAVNIGAFDLRCLERSAQKLRKRVDVDHLVLTRSSDGMTLVSAGGTIHLPAEVREVADVSGAGDTVVATIASALGSGWPIIDACRLASIAAGVAVSHPGTYPVTLDELTDAWVGRSPKILTSERARQKIARAQGLGQKVVFTNGCFDILHAGHLSCLERARRLGDLLVVGLNSDASVKLNKGPSRPIIREDLRAALLAGLACVDIVVLFDELTPEHLVRALSPDALVKGGDYQDKAIAGADFVRERGGEVILLPLVDGLSSSSIILECEGRRV